MVVLDEASLSVSIPFLKCLVVSLPCNVLLCVCVGLGGGDLNMVNTLSFEYFGYVLVFQYFFFASSG